jgi:hypothetical protein
MTSSTTQSSSSGPNVRKVEPIPLWKTFLAVVVVLTLILSCIMAYRNFPEIPEQLMAEKRRR